MSYERCNTCHEWGFTDTHVCPPQWQGRLGSEPDSVRTVYAQDAEEAGSKFAEEFDDDNGHEIVQGRIKDPVVFVRPAPDGDEDTPWHKVAISAEYRPHYYASEIK